MAINHPTEPRLKEASITIGGILIPWGTSATIRVAISQFLESLNDPDALGNDEAGRQIRQGYINNCKQVLHLINRDISR